LAGDPSQQSEFRIERIKDRLAVFMRI